MVKNGVDLSFYKPVDGRKSSDFKRRFGFSNRIVAAYVGTHGLAHGLGTIFEAAEMLKDDARIGFLLVGDGSERKNLELRAKEMSLKNIVIAGQLPKSEMPGVWAATDISLIVLRKSDTFKSVLPSKMFEAMAMQRPIVLGVEGEAKKLLESADAGVSVEPENARELADAVLTLVNDHDRATTHGKVGMAYVQKHFDRKVLAQDCLRVFEGLVS